MKSKRSYFGPLSAWLKTPRLKRKDLTLGSHPLRPLRRAVPGRKDQNRTALGKTSGFKWLQVPRMSCNLTKARCQVEQSNRTSRPCNRSSALQPLSHHCCLRHVRMRNIAKPWVTLRAVQMFWCCTLWLIQADTNPHALSARHNLEYFLVSLSHIMSYSCFFCIVLYVVALSPWHLSHCRQRPPPHGGRRGAPGEVFYNCSFISNLSYLSIVLYCLTVFPKHFSKHFPSSMTTSDSHSDSSHESCSNLPFSCHCSALIVLARVQTGDVAPVVMLPEDCQSIHICRKMRLRSKDVERLFIHLYAVRVQW